jgi:hypothetical protein
MKTLLVLLTFISYISADIDEGTLTSLQSLGKFSGNSILINTLLHII